jgi:hypothetical protein
MRREQKKSLSQRTQSALRKSERIRSKIEIASLTLAMTESRFCDDDDGHDDLVLVSLRMQGIRGRTRKKPLTEGVWSVKSADIGP